MTIKDQEIKKNIKTLQNKVTDFYENINQLQKLIDSDEKETLLSIYIEDGKIKIHNFVEGDPFDGEAIIFDALSFAVASIICKSYKLPEERKEAFDMIKKRIEVSLETL